MGPHLALLPRSSLVRADQHSVGRLAGAASIDRCVRMPGRTWWEAELPTDEQAAGLLDAGASPDVVLAHEALAVPGLIQRLGDGRGWHPDDLAHAREAQRVHTARVLSVLDPAQETLCAAGRYCFRHSEQALLDGMPVRQEIFDRDGSADAMAVLDLGDDVPRFEAVAMGRASLLPRRD
ncbi:hypothetical protein ACFWY6_45555 [Streptomyces sp. NPDC059037]|uniref:hypothetical protein n=1 Tax=Streptomyces sp. NPDC059037 TaxID=3346710 RepID=UPI0036941B81